MLAHIYTPYLMHLSAICKAIAAKGFSTTILYTDAQKVHNPFALREEVTDAQLMSAGW
jgi:hypothetical protein